MDLKDKVVVIAGASSGIGAATAKRLVNEGVSIVLAARDRGRLDTVNRTIDSNAIAVPTDVAKQHEVEHLMERAMDHFGRIDAVFANAGKFIQGDLAQGDPDHWAEGIDLNVTGLLRTLRAALPIMRKRKSGHILMTASVAGRRWIKGQTVYCATKQAVYEIAEGLRLEVQKDNIRVTLISPGWVANEFWDDAIADSDLRKALEGKRAMLSDNVAEVVCFALKRP